MLKTKYKLREPIFLSDLNNSEKEELTNLLNTGDLTQFEEDIFYFPETVKLGNKERTLSIDPNEIIERRYFTNGNEVYGYVSGLTLQNISGLSRQVPSFLELTTNNETQDRNDHFIGGKRVITCKPPVKITKENVNSLQFLDLMSGIDVKQIDDLSLDIFREWLEENPVKYAYILEYTRYFPEIARENLESEVIKNEIT